MVIMGIFEWLSVAFIVFVVQIVVFLRTKRILNLLEENNKMTTLCV